MKQRINILRNLILMYNNRELIKKCMKGGFDVQPFTDEEKDGLSTLGEFGKFVSYPNKDMRAELKKLPKI